MFHLRARIVEPEVSPSRRIAFLRFAHSSAETFNAEISLALDLVCPLNSHGDNPASPARKMVMGGWSFSPATVPSGAPTDVSLGPGLSPPPFRPGSKTPPVRPEQRRDPSVLELTREKKLVGSMGGRLILKQAPIPKSKLLPWRNPTRSKEEQRGRDQNPQKSIKNGKELKRGSSYLFSTGLGLKRAAKGAGVVFKEVAIIANTPLPENSPVCIVYRYTGKCTGTLPTKQPNPSLGLAENPKCTGTTIKVYRYKSCTGRNTVNDLPEYLVKLGTRIKHLNLAICKGGPLAGVQQMKGPREFSPVAARGSLRWALGLPLQESGPEEGERQSGPEKGKHQRGPDEKEIQMGPHWQ
uniref:Uncharacterized protein n=1 Tax=Ananas comosus var. bracteatus TaxID=296719 RepID=A0A6V7NYQ8_ANACO|nr:unnamed protein product [Ananas comosus var. bracteatus]